MSDRNRGSSCRSRRGVERIGARHAFDEPIASYVRRTDRSTRSPNRERHIPTPQIERLIRLKRRRDSVAATCLLRASCVRDHAAQFFSLICRKTVAFY
jgi:hypothetical protein